MTKVRFENIGGKVNVRIEGHAGFRDKGDPVCAGCSILMHTLIKVMGDPKIYDETIPAAEIEFDATPENMIKFDTIMEGYKLISQCYPNHVQIWGEI